MKLVNIHGGLGEFSVTSEENDVIHALFTRLYKKDDTWDIPAMMRFFQEHMSLLFPGVNLVKSDLGAYTAYRRGLIPYNCTGEGQQIITPVENPLGSVMHVELRLVLPSKSDNRFAGFIFPNYQPSCVDDIADLLCKGTLNQGVHYRAILELPQRAQEYGLGAVPFVGQVCEAYAEAAHLLGDAKSITGIEQVCLEVLRSAAEKSKNEVERETARAIYVPKLQQLVDAR
ncbi:hypothetical protein J4211_02525 [Candidatus Woesearchaeota archaeon]|nr:hypothetical protein [Candidatus Woesearchaeota archaeon]